jgi:hypothetical protein
MSGFRTRRGVVVFLLAPIMMGAAQAQGIIAPGNAPASWNAYSMMLHNMVQVWLADNTDAALRLSSYFEGMRTNDHSGKVSLPLEIWIDAKGTATDVRFPLFAHEQANADMLTVLRGREMPEPPPSDMVQPVRLKLTLSAKLAALD